MAAGTVAGVYAQALLELADEQGRRDAVVESCRGLAGASERDTALTPALIGQLDDPRLGKARAKDALQTSLAGKVEAEVLDLLKLLVDRNRLADANAILREAVRIADAAAGRVRVDVVSAAPLSPASIQRLESGLRATLGTGASVVERVDPALIGGMTVRVGDLFVDGSVRRKLTDMKSKILDVPLGETLWQEK